MNLTERVIYLLGIQRIKCTVYIDDADGGADTPGYTKPGVYDFYTDGTCRLNKERRKS